MAQMAPSVGIDISKERLDVAVHPHGPQFSVSNDAVGWHELCRKLKSRGIRAIGLEPSGGYERGVIEALLQAGLPVRSVVATLPCREVRCDPMREHLAELAGARRQLVDLRQMLQNQLSRR